MRATTIGSPIKLSSTVAADFVGAGSTAQAGCMAAATEAGGIVKKCRRPKFVYQKGHARGPELIGAGLLFLASTTVE